jgi:hypothetical protein
VLIALGGLLLAGNLGLLRAEARQVVEIAWATVLVAAGGLLALTRGRAVLLPLQSFAIERRQFERAALTAATGAADLHVRGLVDVGQLAAGEYGGPAAPRLAGRDGPAADIRLDGRRTWPLQAGASWPLALARDIPWDLNLVSSLGDFDLELRDLTIAGLRLRTTFGRVNLTLPAADVTSVDLDLTFGDLTVRVPDGMAVRLKFTPGPLSEFLHDERRFVKVGLDEWVSPLYAVAANRCSLAVRLWAGDFSLV